MNMTKSETIITKSISSLWARGLNDSVEWWVIMMVLNSIGTAMFFSGLEVSTPEYAIFDEVEDDIQFLFSIANQMGGVND